MTLFELLFVALVIGCGFASGFWGYTFGGISWAILCFIAGAVGAFLVTLAIGKVLSATMRNDNPCSDCNEYKWIGGDSNRNPVAECGCGKRFALQKGKWVSSSIETISRTTKTP